MPAPLLQLAGDVLHGQAMHPTGSESTESFHAVSPILSSKCPEHWLHLGAMMTDLNHIRAVAPGWWKNKDATTAEVPKANMCQANLPTSFW